MKKKIRNIFSEILLCCFCIFSAGQISAQSSSSWEPSPWYLGIKGGIPFGVSTFSSFGKDKMRYGYGAGIYGGYNINLTFSVEAFYSKGNISGMSVQDDFNYWLGNDGLYYPSEESGIDGISYNNIYSTSTMQRYGLQWNIDIVQVLYQDEEIRFKLVFSPSVSAVSTRATIKNMENDTTFLDGDRNINPGIGSDLSLGYRIGNHLNAQVYTSFSWVFGDRIDGMPEHLYDDNFIMEYGIKLGWTFGKKRKKAQVNSPAHDYEELQINYDTNKIKRIEPSIIVTTVPKTINSTSFKDLTSANDLTSATEKKIILKPENDLSMPDLIIHDSFNEYFIDYRYIYSLREITEKLESDKALNLYITGCSDNLETEKTGRDIAGIRADYLKAWFIDHGIARERIFVNKNIANLSKSDPNTKETRKTEIRIIK